MRCTEARGRAIAALLGALAAAPAVAQQAGAGQDPSAEQRIGGDELAAFARAARAVHALRQGETEPVTAAVRKRMVEAVEGAGLTLERYNAIARRVRQEGDLYARYQEAWNAQQ
jgi:hypothetical protein